MYRTVADANGHYQLASVKPGRYRIYADRPGFSPARQWLTLSGCQAVRELDLKLIADAAIAGHVYDETGEPLLVNVQLWRETWKHGFRERTELTRQATEEGAYRFFGLTAGRYFVSTVQTPVREARQAYDQTFYPSPLDVSAGSEARDVDFHLNRTATVTLGLLIEGTLTPDQFVSIDLENPARKADLHLATNDPKFEIDGLTAGSYKLTATSRYEDRLYYALLNIDIGSGDVRGLPVRLLPALEVKAKLRFQGTKPSGEVSMSLSPRHTARPESDGTYKWSDVVPGTYNLSADLPDGFYLKSHRATEVSPGNQGPFEIDASAGAAHLEGTVQFPDTVDQVRVVLVGTEVEKNALATPDGRFSLKGIVPGQYTLFAVEEEEAQTWRNPDKLNALVAKGVKLDLAEGSTVHRDLSLTR
jgi:hypothetical protein